MEIRNFLDARHLASRMNIGVEYTVIKSYLGKKSGTILADALSDPQKTLNDPTLSPWGDIVNFLTKKKSERQDLNKKRWQDINTLRAWWLEHMHHTDTPLQERMIIFWHNHFTSSINKVRWPQLMYRQHKLFRQQATGNFAQMLKAIPLDPAMMIYLDGRKNIAAKPNENFARELLELFTLGVGHYSENDVTNAARAFTGWAYNIRDDRVIFHQRHHDNGNKQFLGKTGNFGADEIIDILLDHPRTAEFIAGKLWQEFVSNNTPDKEIISQWGKIFRESSYDIRTLLSTIIQSDVFWSAANRGVLIKSPIELTVGMLRELRIDNFKHYARLASANQRLGQALFAPPDVKGWRGGEQWIDNTKLIERYNLLEKLLQEDVLAKMHDKQNPLHSLSINEISEWLLPITPVDFPEQSANREDALLDILKDPTYQLR